MKTQGPKIKIEARCFNCKYLESEKEYWENDETAWYYKCGHHNKSIGYSSRDTPDWCEFKTINIENLLKELKL